MRAPRRLVTALAVVGSTVGGGCQAVLGLGDLAPADGGTRDAARDAARPIGDARADSTRMADGGDAGCPVVYVSTTGTDGPNSGCAQGSPLKTISHALSVVPPNAEVHVCAGDYTETDLTLGTATSLRGGYDCASWLRPTGWGFPAFSATKTTINPSPQNTKISTLLVAAAAADAGPGASPLGGFTVDGFTIYGATGVVTSRALIVGPGVAPAVSNNHIVGGTGTPEVGSWSVALSLNVASADVSDNLINFVQATSPAPCVGVYVTTDGTSRSAAHIHGNQIQGGNGTVNGTGPDQAGSVGLALMQGSVPTSPGTQFTVAAGAAVEGNSITARNGFASQGKPAAIGLVVYGLLTADVIGNVIGGGTGDVAGDAATPDHTTYGVSSSGAATLRLLGNRIYGGAENTGVGGTVGVFSSSSVVLVNNMIHGGNVLKGDLATSSTAVSLNKVDAAVVEDNTLYAGSVTASDPATGRVYALALNNGYGAIVRGNILAGAGTSRAGVTNGILQVDDCAELALLRNNLFINEETHLLVSSTCRQDGGSGTTQSMKEVEAILGPAAAGANYFMTQACGASDLDAGLCGSGCPDAGCMPWLLSGWTAGSPSSGVLDAGSWALHDGAACVVANGGANLAHAEAGPTVTVDIADAARPADGSSMGARQYSAPCR